MQRYDGTSLPQDEVSRPTYETLQAIQKQAEREEFNQVIVLSAIILVGTLALVAISLWYKQRQK